MIYFSEWLNIPWLAHVKPWAGLFCLAVLLSYWNWRAMILVCCGILLARIAVHFLPQPIVAVMMGYSLLAAVSVFYIDVVAGLVFAVISLLTVAQLFVGSAVILTEIALIVGMFACAYDGVSGGLFRGDNPRSFGRLADPIYRMALSKGAVEKD